MLLYLIPCQHDYHSSNGCRCTNVKVGLWLMVTSSLEIGPGGDIGGHLGAEDDGASGC